MYKMRIELFICAVIFFTGTSTRAALDGNKTLLKKLSILHYQLFNSIQKGMTMLTSAHFETSCTKMGCSITKYQSTRRPGPVIPKPKGCRKGWKEYNGHCYKQPSIPLNWFNAQMYCRKHGAHLAKVDDESENYWISRAFPLNKDVSVKLGYPKCFILLKKFKPGDTNVSSLICKYLQIFLVHLEKWYTDFTDLGKEGVWKSFTFGDEAVYTNWIKGNPSNSNSREHCVEINCEYLGLWNDVPCEAVLKFVCESYGYME